MNWKASLIAALVFASPLALRAAPVTFQEISMLLRNKERQPFIFSEVEKRKLLQPLSKQEEAVLKGLGATPALLIALRSPTVLAPPEAVAAYKARAEKSRETPEAAPQPQPPAQQEAPRAVEVIPPSPAPTVASEVAAAKTAAPITLYPNNAFELSQLDEAKAKAQAQKKPLGFVMVWGEFFGKQGDPRGTGSLAAFAHFYHAFNNTLVLVFVRHESELRDVPGPVEQGFTGPAEGGYAPNMAVVDATARQLIIEIPMGGAKGDGAKRDRVFAAAATKIDQWLAAHPDALPTAPPPQ
jgi:hypothetical protein